MDLAHALGMSKHNAVSMWENGSPPSPINLAALRDLFGPDLVEPTPPPDAASLAFWRGRVEQIAHHMRAVLSEQEALASDMAGTPYAPDHNTEPEARATPPAPAVRKKGTARG